MFSPHASIFSKLNYPFSIQVNNYTVAVVPITDAIVVQPKRVYTAPLLSLSIQGRESTVGCNFSVIRGISSTGKDLRSSFSISGRSLLFNSSFDIVDREIQVNIAVNDTSLACTLYNGGI